MVAAGSESGGHSRRVRPEVRPGIPGLVGPGGEAGPPSSPGHGPGQSPVMSGPVSAGGVTGPAHGDGTRTAAQPGRPPSGPGRVSPVRQRSSGTIRTRSAHRRGQDGPRTPAPVRLTSRRGRRAKAICDRRNARSAGPPRPAPAGRGPEAGDGGGVPHRVEQAEPLVHQGPHLGGQGWSGRASTGTRWMGPCSWRRHGRPDQIVDVVEVPEAGAGGEGPTAAGDLLGHWPEVSVAVRVDSASTTASRFRTRRRWRPSVNDRVIGAGRLPGRSPCGGLGRCG